MYIPFSYYLQEIKIRFIIFFEKYQITESDDKFVVTITAEAFAAFVELDLIEADAIFADNYFNISGNEAVTVELKKSDIWNKEKINISELDRTLKIRSLFDTYQS